MNWQNAFDVAIGMLWAIGGWFMRILWDSHRDVKMGVDNLRQSLPDIYARRDDVRDIKNDVKELRDAIFLKLDKIEEKIDIKADK